ncbi:MAG: hypothetical protein WBD16_01100 [Pyrinomonadaceae bacterium]
MNLLIGNDTELSKMLRKLRNVEQIAHAANQLGRKSREVTRAAQRLELMDFLQVNEDTALLIQRAGFVSLGALAKATSEDELLAGIKLEVEATGKHAPPTSEVKVWYHKAKASKHESIIFQCSRRRSGDPFSVDSKRHRASDHRPHILKQTIRPVPIEPLVSPCDGLLKPIATELSPHSIELVLNAAGSVIFNRTIRVYGKDLEQSTKFVRLTAVTESFEERPNIPNKFFYSGKQPIIRDNVFDQSAPRKWVEFEFPKNLKPVPGLYRVTVLHNPPDEKCESNPLYLRLIAPNAVGMLVARIFNLGIIEDRDSLGTGEAIWGFGGGTPSGPLMVRTTSSMPGRNHLSVEDNEDIGRPLFPYFSIPIFDRRIDRMGDQLLLVFSAVEEGGGDFLVPLLTAVGAGIGAYFENPAAGAKVGEKIGDFLTDPADSFGSIEAVTEVRDNWGVPKTPPDNFRDLTRATLEPSQIAYIDYAIQEVGAPELISWKVIFQTIELVNLGDGDEEEDIDVWYRVHAGYDDSPQMGLSSKKFFSESEGKPGNILQMKTPNGQPIKKEKEFPGNPKLIPYFYVEVIVCKDEDANFGTLATTVFTQDIFSQMYDPLADKAAIDITMNARGTGDVGGSCNISFRIEVERL